MVLREVRRAAPFVWVRRWAPRVEYPVASTVTLASGEGRAVVEIVGVVAGVLLTGLLVYQGRRVRARRYARGRALVDELESRAAVEARGTRLGKQIAARVTVHGRR